MSDKFDAAYRLRQKILDFLNETPGMYSTTEIANKLEFNRDYVCRAVKTMVEREEVKRHGPGWNATYTPLKTITFLAEKARTSQREHVVEPDKKVEPWCYIHKHKDDHQISKNLSGSNYVVNNFGGGQGATRQKVFIKSCMG